MLTDYHQTISLTIMGLALLSMAYTSFLNERYEAEIQSHIDAKDPVFTVKGTTYRVTYKD